MTDSAQPSVARTVLDLLARTELTEVRTYLLRAGRGTHADPDDPEMLISARVEPEWIEVRCRLTVQSSDADLVVDRSAVFSHTEPLEVSSETTREFIEKVGVMTVYPYLREAVTRLASDLGVSAPVMGLLRAGSIRVDELAEDQKAGGPPAAVKRRGARTAAAQPSPRQPAQDH